MTIDIVAIVNSYSEQVVELREENERLKARIKDLENKLSDVECECDDYRAIVHDRALEGDHDAIKVWRGWIDDEDEDAD